MAYELELPEGSRVHNVFHVSHLKKALGHIVTPLVVLPSLDEEGKLVLIPKAVIDFREWTIRKVITEYLVKWWVYQLRMLLGRVSRFYSILHCDCLRTNNLGEGGL